MDTPFCPGILLVLTFIGPRVHLLSKIKVQASSPFSYFVFIIVLLFSIIIVIIIIIIGLFLNHFCFFWVNTSRPVSLSPFSYLPNPMPADLLRPKYPWPAKAIAPNRSPTHKTTSLKPKQT